METSSENKRIDKWLWTVRLFKTRTQAADACKGGKVKLDGVALKPAHEAKVNEIITVQIGRLCKIVQIIGFPKNRLAAKMLAPYILDLTPPEEYRKLELMHDSVFIKRDRGSGRPTKKERRDLEQLF